MGKYISNFAIYKRNGQSAVVEVEERKKTECEPKQQLKVHLLNHLFNLFLNLQFVKQQADQSLRV